MRYHQRGMPRSGARNAVAFSAAWNIVSAGTVPATTLLTDEGRGGCVTVSREYLEVLKACVGQRGEPHTAEVEKATVRKFARAIGEGSRLYFDEAYARTARVPGTNSAVQSAALGVELRCVHRRAPHCRRVDRQAADGARASDRGVAVRRGLRVLGQHAEVPQPREFAWDFIAQMLDYLGIRKAGDGG